MFQTVIFTQFYERVVIMGATIRLEGDVQALLQKMKNLSHTNISGTLASIGQGLRTSTIERFREERSPEGNKWESSIRANQTGDKTLTDTAVLRNSIKVKVSESGIVVGTNDIRAATHQFGDTRTIRAKRDKYLRFQINGSWVSTPRVKVKIPKRPFLGVSDTDQAEIRQELETAVFGEE